MSDRASEVSREEACRLLGLSPKNLRNLWLRYAALLGSEKPPRRLTLPLLDMLRQISTLRSQGRSEPEILVALAAGPASGMESVPETAAFQQIQGVEERLEEIAQRLAVNEARRAHDHDRLVTSLMRTQQELNHLRYEVAASVPRRERRAGFMARVFGIRERKKEGA